MIDLRIAALSSLITELFIAKSKCYNRIFTLWWVENPVEDLVKVIFNLSPFLMPKSETEIPRREQFDIVSGFNYVSCFRFSLQLKVVLGDDSTWFRSPANSAAGTTSGGARTASTAGFSNTLAPPNSERAVGLLSNHRTSIKFFLASSTALRIASGTSWSLPVSYTRWIVVWHNNKGYASRRRPPLTTFVTRWQQLHALLLIQLHW